MSQVVLAIIALAEVLLKVFGPTVARLWQAEAESIRSKNPNRAEAMDITADVFSAVVNEIETFPRGSLSQEEYNRARRNGAIQEGMARLVQRGVKIDEGDARIQVEKAVKAIKVLAGGKAAAPDAPEPVGS